jgi:hypothetical protein
MRNLCVVGIGGIGFRHAQSLLSQLETGDKLYAVDPSEMARENFNASISIENKNHVFFLSDIKNLPESIDFLIIATSSMVRLEVVSSVLINRRIKFLILEKFLFPTIEEHWQAFSILKKTNTPSYVNHPRRYYPINQELREILKNTPFEIDVLGGNWGLLCNAMHFIDLCQFFSRSSALLFNKFEIKKFFPSKRKGYTEAFGVIEGMTGNGRFRLETSEESTAPLQIKIKNKYLEVLIEESSGKIIINGNKNLNQNSSLTNKKLMLYQSEITGRVYKDTISAASIILPEYITSATSHIVFLSALKSATANSKTQDITEIIIT